MTGRILSSLQTFSLKFIFPAIWITGFGAGTISLWSGVFDTSRQGSPPLEMKVGFLVMWILGSAFILWTCSRLKRVRLDANTLYVSNYRLETAVPVALIERVTENRWINIHPVTIHFRQPTEFGDRITFMPTARFFSWSSHPVVAELLSAAQNARADARHARI